MAYGMQPQSDPTAVMGRRVVAYLIDALLLAGIGIAVMAVTKNNAYTGAPNGACTVLRNTPGFSGQCVQIGSRVYTWKTGGFVLGYGLSAVVGFCDLVLLQGIIGASVGKLIVGLRVVDAQGKPCGVGRAFVRWLILVVLDAACFLIGLLTAGLTHPHRRVGDMAAGTYVVALADIGRPISGTAPPYQYAPGQYAPGQAYPQDWTPPGTAAQPAGWGATSPPAWGAPGVPGAPQPTTGWGAPPTTPTWGAPPADTAPPTWGAPEPAPTPGPGWATPAPPADNPGPPWGTPAAPAPAPAASPTPPPPAAPAPTPPPPPAPAAPPPAAPTWNPPTPTPPAATPPAVAPTPPPAATPPAATPPSPAPAAPTDGESWWNKAFTEDDDETPQ